MIIEYFLLKKKLKIRVNDKPILLKHDKSAESLVSNVSTSGSYNRYVNNLNENVFTFENFGMKQTACFSPVFEKKSEINRDISPKLNIIKKNPNTKLPPVQSTRNPLKKINLDNILDIAHQYREDFELQTKIDLLVKNILDIKNVLQTKRRDIKSAPSKKSNSVRKTLKWNFFIYFMINYKIII